MVYGTGYWIIAVFACGAGPDDDDDDDNDDVQNLKAD